MTTSSCYSNPARLTSCAIPATVECCCSAPATRGSTASPGPACRRSRVTSRSQIRLLRNGAKIDALTRLLSSVSTADDQQRGRSNRANRAADGEGPVHADRRPRGADQHAAQRPQAAIHKEQTQYPSE